MSAPTTLLGTIAWVLGGLALFLYGIDVMGEALRKAAGPALRSAFESATRTRWRALLVGFLATALVQSSSATTVMVVGFINAGLLTLANSIGLILGANIGSTVTPLITAFDIGVLSVPLLGVGMLVYMFGRRRVVRQAGRACLGFGMLFLGLVLMKLAVSHYRPDIQRWLGAYLGGTFRAQALAFLVAVVATAIVQSSAASIAMVQALVVGGGITNFEYVFPFILGAHIGTCITALLASLRVSLSGKRAAVANVVFNIIGSAIAFGLAPLYFWLIPRLSDRMAMQIALGHLSTQVVNALIFLAIAPWFARFITWIVPGRDIFNAAPEYLDYAAIKTTPRALDCARREIHRMFGTCTEMLRDAVAAFLASNDRRLATVARREQLVDDLNRTIAEYLLRVSRRAEPVESALQLQVLLQVMSDVERIGDHAENITELTSMYAAEHVSLSTTAQGEVTELAARVAELARAADSAFDAQDPSLMSEVLRVKREINDYVDTVLDNHTTRLAEGTCRPVSGLVFVELVMNLRRVANHLRNIAAGLTLEQPEHTAPVHQLKQEIEFDRQHDINNTPESRS